MLVDQLQARIRELEEEVERLKYIQGLSVDIINGRGVLEPDKYTFHDVRIGTGDIFHTKRVVVDYSIRKLVQINNIDPAWPVITIGCDDMYDFAVMHVSHGEVNKCPEYLKD